MKRFLTILLALAVTATEFALAYFASILDQSWAINVLRVWIFALFMLHLFAWMLTLVSVAKPDDARVQGYVRDVRELRRWPYWVADAGIGVLLAAGGFVFTAVIWVGFIFSSIMRVGVIRAIALPDNANDAAVAEPQPTQA